MRKHLSILCLTGILSVGSGKGLPEKKTLLFADDFSGDNLSPEWIIEQNGKEKNVCFVKDGVMELNADGGITVWYKQELKGNILIEYDRKVVMKGGTHDRLSDLNQFWMATDPANRMFTRKGDFREYDSLQMYYTGMGGNYNSTTRFRRYDGMGTKKLIGEYTDSLHLLQPNRNYHISIRCKNGEIRFMVNNEIYFNWKDESPLKNGWFAVRSTRSHQQVDNLKIWQLE